MFKSTFKLTFKLTLGLMLVLPMMLMPDSPTGNTHIHVTAHRLENTDKAPLIDGHPNEKAWQKAPVFSGFKMVKPNTGVAPSEKTELRVLYDKDNLYISVYCFSTDPKSITVTDLRHDQRGSGNDLVRILLDPFLDKRNAYVFCVNPGGARIDGLATGEHFSPNWDGIWDAAGTILKDGWCAEIRIPFKTISFNPKLVEWGMNVERFIAQKTETIRLSGISKDSFFYNPAEAALMRPITRIKQGLGMTFKPYGALDTGRDYPANGTPDNDRQWTVNRGFDLYKNFTPNLVGVLTYRTDFAETEVDDRQINLTRFSLYYPEKRAFFLEGSEIFAFEGGGGGHRPHFIPFFSRRIGLYEEEQVPLDWGLKVYGKMGNTNMALLNVRSRPFTSDMGPNFPGQHFLAGRIYQNIFSESKVGIIFTSGEPGSEGPNTLFGVDFKYATHRFLKNKNFALSGWWATNHNQLQGGKHHGYGFKVDYPNDLLDMAVTYAFFGDSLQPGLGFLPRNGVHMISSGFQFRPRPTRGFVGRHVRQLFLRLFTSFYWNPTGQLESYRISVTPFLMAKTESGDQLEFYFIFQREILNEMFEVSEGVFIPPGDYRFNRYQLEFRSAQHRKVTLESQYEVGTFYGGRLRKFDAALDFNYKGYLKLGLQGIFIRGTLPQGDFRESLYRVKTDFYLNPDLGLMTYLQYDSVSENIGANIRFKWRLSPGNTIFLVYNKNWERFYDVLQGHLPRFMPLQDRGIIKLQLSWRP